MKLFKAFLHLFVALLLVSQTSIAQTYIPPSLPDSLLDTEDTLTAISCDMLDCPDAALGGQLIAVAYSYKKGSGTESWVFVKYIHTNGTVVSMSPKRIPNASHIDVVLADNKLTPGFRYNVFYVYNVDSPAGSVIYPLIKYARYNLTVSTSGITASSGGDGRLGIGQRPRVDMFPDATDTFSNGTPKMYDFVATWSTSFDTMYLATGYVNSNSSVMNYKIPAFETFMPDVGAQFDLDTPRKIAHLTYLYKSIGPHAFFHTAINMSTTPPTILAIDTLVADTVEPTFGATEAVGLYKRGLGGVSWGCLHYDRLNDQAVHYNSLTNYGYNFGPAYEVGSQSIAVGLGLPKNGGKIGNANYTVGWYDSSAGEYYSQYVNIGTGLRSNPTDYYEVCSTNTTELLALSSSSNSGNNILAAWWDGTDIYWKLTNNSPGYKPANDNDEDSVQSRSIVQEYTIVEKLTTMKRWQAAEDHRISEGSPVKARVYPNPATSQLHVDGYGGAAYRVIDAMGRTVLSGTITAQPIKIQELNPGCYIIQLEGKGPKASIRFSKY